MKNTNRKRAKKLEVAKKKAPIEKEPQLQVQDAKPPIQKKTNKQKKTSPQRKKPRKGAPSILRRPKPNYTERIESIDKSIVIEATGQKEHIWPDFLAATHLQFVLVRENKIHTIMKGGGPYYGISWDQEQVYVGKRYGGAGIIHTVSPSLEIGSLPGTYDQVHQIFHTGSRLYITITGDDEVAIWQNNQCVRKHWVRRGRVRDTAHINSIWVDPAIPQDAYVVCHNLTTYTQRDSQLLLMDIDLQVVKKSYKVGGDAHNIWVYGDKAYICDSIRGRFLEYNLSRGTIDRVIQLSRWPRGLAITDKYMIVGESIIGIGPVRNHGSLTLNLIDREHFKVVDSKEIHGLGAVCEIRVLGERDYAHNGISCPVDWENYDNPII